MKQIKKDSSLWRLLRGTLAYSLLPLVGLVTAPLLARALGPTGRGQLAAVLQPLAVADAILLAGVPTAVTFFIGRGYKFRDVKNAVAVVTSCSILFTAFLMFIYSGHISNVTNISRIFILMIWSASILGLLIALRRSVFQGHGQLAILDTERALSAILRLVAIVAVVLLGVTHVGPFLVAYILPGVIAALILLQAPKPKGLPHAPEGFSDNAPIRSREFYAYSIFAGGGHIASTLNSRLDQAILPLSLSLNELGLYSVAVTLAEVPLILSLVVTRNLLSEASRGSPMRSIANTAMLGCAIMIVVVIALWISAPWATTLLFGDAFSAASDVVRILLVGTFFAFVTAAISAIMAGTGKPGRSAVAPIIGVLCLVLGLAAFADGMDSHVAAFIVVGSRIICSFVAVLLMLVFSKLKKVKNDAQPHTGA